MPTHEETEAFLRDYKRLSPEQRRRFDTVLIRFIEDLRSMKAGRRNRFRPGLRVKAVQGVAGLYEMTWAGDRRATFSWGPAIAQGVLHVVWERCGNHDIFP